MKGASRRLMMTMASSCRPVKPVITVIGATGTGKSQLAVDLAARFEGEIINADAMQMYDGLPIITNKVSVAEQRGVPHHLLGCVRLEEPPWHVSKFVAEASKIIEAIHERGKLPIIVGGTNYYLQTLLFRQKPPVDEPPTAKSPHPDLDLPTDALYAKLKEVDPIMANRWHPSDHRKIRRSLEIWYQTGKLASEHYHEQALEKQERMATGRSSLIYPTLLFWTDATRNALKERLDDRVDTMMEAGLLDEVRQMHSSFTQFAASGCQVDLSKGVWVSIGYKQFVPYIEAAQAETHEDEVDHPSLFKEALEATKASTRQYANTQVRWIRIKLHHALRDADASKQLFLLDTTDCSPSAWSQSILPTATGVAASFLEGRDLPDPMSLCPLAAEMLHAKQDYDLSQRPDLWQARSCEHCGVTAVTEREWLEHVHGGRHKRTVRRHTKKAERTQVQSEDPVD